MTSSLLEIVELADGEIVLQRAGSRGEPLLVIRFSAETKDLLPAPRIEVAKAMIQAGIQAAARLAGGEAELDFIGATGSAHTVLH